MPWNALWFKRNEPLKKHHSFLVGVRASSGLSPGPQPLSCSISAGCSHLARRLSGPALERVRERADLVKAEQPAARSGRWSSPLTEARVEGLVRRRRLPGPTDAFGAAEAWDR